MNLALAQLVQLLPSPVVPKPAVPKRRRAGEPGRRPTHRDAIEHFLRSHRHQWFSTKRLAQATGVRFNSMHVTMGRYLAWQQVPGLQTMTIGRTRYYRISSRPVDQL
jgi:hypothetical protein